MEKVSPSEGNTPRIVYSGDGIGSLNLILGMGPWILRETSIPPTLRIQTPPDLLVGLMVYVSHPQVIGLVRGNPLPYNILQYWLVVSTHLKNISQIGVSPGRGENKQYLKPPPSYNIPGSL